MKPTRIPTRAIAAACATLACVILAACGTAVSTGSFKGEEHAVAQGVANLQADATAGDQGKICAQDLAAAVVASLGGAKRCEAVIKEQLGEIDNLETTVQSVQLAGAGRAGAVVKSIYGGKSRLAKVSLVKEGGRWKLAGPPGG